MGRPVRGVKRCKPWCQVATWGSDGGTELLCGTGAVQSPHPLSQHTEHSRASRLWFTASQIWRALLFKYNA